MTAANEMESEGSDGERPGQELAWLDRPTRELARLAWPIAVSMVSYSVMTLVDTLFVGRLGAPSLAGVGLGGVAAFTLICFGFGLLRAVKVLTSQAVGAGRPYDLSAYLGAGLVAAGALGVAGLLIGQLVAELLPALAASSEAGTHARTYLRIRALGTPFILAYCALREHRYGLGDSRSPMWAAVSANAANIVLDWLFIVQLGLGVGGAAWATLAAHAVEGTVLVLAQRRSGFGLARTGRRHLRALFAVGMPTGVQFLLEVGSFSILAGLLAALSAVEMAAHQIALAVMHLTFLPALAIAEAGSVLAGQAVGAGRDELVRAVSRRAMAVSGAYAVLCTVGLVGFARGIAESFADDLAVVAATIPLLWVAAVFQIADAGGAVARSVLRGTGDVTWPAIVGITCAWLFLPGGTWLFGYRAGLGALGGWIALCCEIVVGSAIFWWRLERGGWRFAATRSRARIAEEDAPPEPVAPGQAVLS